MSRLVDGKPGIGLMDLERASRGWPNVGLNLFEGDGRTQTDGCGAGRFILPRSGTCILDGEVASCGETSARASVYISAEKPIVHGFRYI